MISIIFLEFWKRRQFELQYDWDLSNIASDHYPIRAEYEAAAIKERIYSNSFWNYIASPFILRRFLASENAK